MYSYFPPTKLKNKKKEESIKTSKKTKELHSNSVMLSENDNLALHLSQLKKKNNIFLNFNNETMISKSKKKEIQEKNKDLKNNSTEKKPPIINDKDYKIEFFTNLPIKEIQEKNEHLEDHSSERDDDIIINEKSSNVEQLSNESTQKIQEKNKDFEAHSVERDDFFTYDEDCQTQFLTEKQKKLLEQSTYQKKSFLVKNPVNDVLKKNLSEGNYLNAFLNSGADILNVPKISWKPFARGVSVLMSWFKSSKTEAPNSSSKVYNSSTSKTNDETEVLKTSANNQNIFSSNETENQKIENPIYSDLSALSEQHKFSEKSLERKAAVDHPTSTHQKSWKNLRATNVSINTAITSKLLQKEYKNLLKTPALDMRFLSTMDDSYYTINGKSATNENPHDVLDLIRKEIPNFQTQQLISSYTHSGLLVEPLKQLQIRYPDLRTEEIFDMFTSYNIRKSDHDKVHITITRTVDIRPPEDELENFDIEKLQSYGLRTDMTLTKYANPTLKYSYFVS